MHQGGVLRRSLGWLAVSAAAMVIILAIVVGIARLLLPLAPDYQDEIRRFASDATGFDVRFERLSASWPLQGPEVRFSAVRIFTLVDQRPVFDARELSVGVNLWRLLVERRLRLGRVAISGASFKAERQTAGQWLINGVPLEELLRRPTDEPLPRLDLQLQNIDVLLLDSSRLEPRVALNIDQLSLGLAPDLISFAGEFDGRDGLGSGIEVSGTVPPAILLAQAATAAQAAPAASVWDVRARGSDLDVARLLRVLANEPLPLLAGRGDVDLEASFSRLTPGALAVDLDMGPTVWQGVSADDNTYQRLALRADWKSTATGWEATLGRLAVERGGKTSPVSSGSVRYTQPAEGRSSLSAAADNIRLQDLWPLLWSVASTGLRRDLLPERLQGEVRDFNLTASFPEGQVPTWTAAATVEDLGLVMPAPRWAVTGVTGTIQADQTGGRINLNSAAGLVRFPELFRADIRINAATGELGWKRSERGLEVLGDDLLITTPDGEIQSRLRVLLPAAGPIFIDLASRFAASSAPAALNYVPLKRMRPNVVEWLDRAFVAGSVPGGELLWQGPLKGFPYEAGDGRFRLEFKIADAVIDYAPDWPRLENASGTVIIDRVSLSSVENRGSIGGIPFDDAEIRVANLLHDAELDVAATDQVQLGQILGFLRQTPLAALLGPTLQSVTGSGDVTTTIDLRLPIARPVDYRLLGTFGLEGASLGLRGVDFGLTAIEGTVRLNTDRLAADQLAAKFLNEPVSIGLRAARPDEAELSQVAEVQGETPTGKLAAAFSLPYAERLGGSVAWNATVQVPARRAKRPLSIQIASDLDQFSSTLAEPMTKQAGTSDPLRMEVSLPERGKLQVSGSIERGVSWALQFLSDPRAPPGVGKAAERTDSPVTARRAKGGWRLERGSVLNGTVLASLPADPGLEIGGKFSSLRFEDWFLGRSTRGNTGDTAPDLLRQIVVDADAFAVFGRVFRDVKLDARRMSGEWRIAVLGPSAAGTVTVPARQSDDAPLLLDMQRLWLLEADPAVGDGVADPRNLPPVRAAIADFALKEMRFGKLTAELAQRGDGVVVEPLVMESPTFSIKGDATWVVEGDDVAEQRSELRLQLQSTGIGPTLEALGYRPVVVGEKAGVTLDLFWPGGPSEDFLNTAGGRVVLSLDKGQFLSVEPGGGRIVGLLSIAALPRRLGLDFSDIVSKGLAFDEVKGEFRLDKGSAYTCNFGLEGPVTDIGVLGRVSLRDRTYDQLAVVRPHVSDVLAVGGFVGGPLVGGTVLLISQIFRKTLSTFGESYYRVSGVWDQPVIDKVNKSEVDLTPFRNCERYLAEALRELPPEAELTR